MKAAAKKAMKLTKERPPGSLQYTPSPFHYIRYECLRAVLHMRHNGAAASDSTREFGGWIYEVEGH